MRFMPISFAAAKWLGNLANCITHILCALVLLATFGAINAQASTLRFSAAAPVRSFDPAKGTLGAIEWNYQLLVYSRLVYFDDKLNVIPDLAESWESSPDLKTWTFHLRKGVKFHNGRELTADDVVATFKRLQDPAIGSVLLQSMKIVSSIDAPDPYTVRFTLSSPYSGWPAVTAAFQASILPRDHLDTITTQPIGTGPYKFVDYQANGMMRLAKNPDYFIAGEPKIDNVEIKIIPDYTTAVAALQNGELDIVWNMPPEYIDQLKGNTSVHVSEVPTGTWETFNMDGQIPPFNNPKVRQAFFKLVDRQAITDIALFGHGSPTISPIPPFHPFYDAAIAIPKPDIAGAKKLLADAGYPNGLSVPLWMPAQLPTLERMGVALRDVAKQAGMNIDIREVPEEQYNAVPHELSIGSFYARTTPDTMLYEWYHIGGGYNRFQAYSNPEVDQILDAARQTADVAEQKRLYTRFQEIAVNDGPGVAVYVANHADGVSNKVQGFKPSPIGVLNINEVTIAP